MARLAGIVAFVGGVLLTATAWCQFPYSGSPYAGSALSPQFSPSFGGYPLWQVRANPLTGNIESRALVIDSTTGNVQVHQRVIPRPSPFGGSGVYDTTWDPATGTVRHHSLTTDGFSNQLQTNRQTYNPYTGAYDRQVSSYQPYGGTMRSTREAYNPATRRTSTEVTEYDPNTGVYYRRGGIPQENGAQEAQPPGRQIKVLEWPPKQSPSTEKKEPDSSAT